MQKGVDLLGSGTRRSRLLQEAKASPKRCLGLPLEVKKFGLKQISNLTLQRPLAFDAFWKLVSHLSIIIMVNNCCVLCCKSEHNETSSVCGISSHRFPSNPERASAWPRAIHRDDSVISKHSRLCRPSAHFLPTDYFINQLH